MKIEHIYLFSSYNIKGISTRYRGVYVLNELYKKHGISSTFVYPGYSLMEIVNFIRTYLKVLFTSRKNTIVVYQKIHTKGIYTMLLRVLLRIRPKGTIYDTDDADYLRYFDKNIFYFMKNCKMCTVGSIALKEFTKTYNSNILLLTSPVIRHKEIKNNGNKILHIGWIGDYGLNKGFSSPFSHKISLNQILFPILLELEFVFKLTILGVKNPADKKEIQNMFKHKNNIILNIPERVNWLNEKSVYSVVKEFDIGVSPMIKNEFNISKSAFKAKQYLSCGVPVLASPIGENLTFVKDGFNGFICHNSKEFKEKIIKINNMDIEEYDLLRNNTSFYVEEFSMTKYCNDLIDGITQHNTK
jgi:glycosyltransferase involved in cell wall biosynthesis